MRKFGILGSKESTLEEASFLWAWSPRIPSGMRPFKGIRGSLPFRFPRRPPLGTLHPSLTRTGTGVAAVLGSLPHVLETPLLLCCLDIMFPASRTGTVAFSWFMLLCWWNTGDKIPYEKVNASQPAERIFLFPLGWR